MALPGVVEPEAEMREPARVVLDHHDSQIGMSLEDAAEHHHHDDVLVASHRHDLLDQLGPADRHAIAVLAGQDVEADREAELDGSLPDRRIARVVVVLEGRVATEHHALESLAGDLPELAHAFFGRGQGDHGDADEARGIGGAELREPAVVGFEAGLAIAYVLVEAEDHAGARVDHFAGHVLFVLDREARLRVVGRWMDRAPGLGFTPILEAEARAGQHAGGDREVHARHDHDRALFGIFLRLGPKSPELRVDLRITGIDLDHMGVGREERLHGVLQGNWLDSTTVAGPGKAGFGDRGEGVGSRLA